MAYALKQYFIKQLSIPEDLITVFQRSQLSNSIQSWWSISTKIPSYNHIGLFLNKTQSAGKCQIKN